MLRVFELNVKNTAFAQHMRRVFFEELVTHQKQEVNFKQTFNYYDNNFIFLSYLFNELISPKNRMPINCQHYAFNSLTWLHTLVFAPSKWSSLCSVYHCAVAVTTGCDTRGAPSIPPLGRPFINLGIHAYVQETKIRKRQTNRCTGAAILSSFKSCDNNTVSHDVSVEVGTSWYYLSGS